MNNVEFKTHIMRYFDFKKQSDFAKEEFIKLSMQWFTAVASPDYDVIQGKHFNPGYYYESRLAENRTGLSSELSKKEKAVCRLKMIEFLLINSVYNDTEYERLRDLLITLISTYRMGIMSSKVKEDHIQDNGYHKFIGVNKYIADLSNGIYMHLQQQAKENLK